MGVLSAAEHSELDLVTVESAGPRLRLTVPVPTAGSPARPDAAGRRRAGGAHSATPAAGRPEPGHRELRVRQVRVTETRVRELGKIGRAHV